MEGRTNLYKRTSLKNSIYNFTGHQGGALLTVSATFIPEGILMASDIGPNCSLRVNKTDNWS